MMNNKMFYEEVQQCAIFLRRERVKWYTLLSKIYNDMCDTMYNFNRNVLKPVCFISKRLDFRPERISFHEERESVSLPRRKPGFKYQRIQVKTTEEKFVLRCNPVGSLFELCSSFRSQEAVLIDFPVFLILFLPILVPDKSGLVVDYMETTSDVANEARDSTSASSKHCTYSYCIVYVSDIFI
ncbi:hypothetical protein ANN_10589 [Periplaneta americana]|uniref:Uncharacterized protein n=1 Tax=Periplaneta americana TaxID=6978 RepID=A0ABQ8TPE7_PERAM|nr:hypothetical protein ANN_10589 [Periplaneta americana]